MADFIVSGQIPGTTVQITFMLWIYLVGLILSALALRSGYRSLRFRSWLIAWRLLLNVRSLSITLN